MLFSATMPGPIVALARRFLRQPMHIRAEGHEESRAVPQTKQFVYRAHAMDKVEMLARILQAEGRGLTMVFCRTKRTAQKVADDLDDRGFAAAAVHGDLGQGAREQALRAFRSGKIDVLVATDVAARGLDVEGVTHVINYQCPEDEKTYLHRIGRTGRAGRHRRRGHVRRLGRHAPLEDDQRRAGPAVPEPAETYSTSEHLYADLDIPTERDRHAAARRSAPGPGWRPRRSRTSARPARPRRALGPEPDARSASAGRVGRIRGADRADRVDGSDGEAPSSGPGESRPRRARSRRRTRGRAAGGRRGRGGGRRAPEDEPVTAAELAGAVATVEAGEAPGPAPAAPPARVGQRPRAATGQPGDAAPTPAEPGLAVAVPDPRPGRRPAAGLQRSTSRSRPEAPHR